MSKPGFKWPTCPEAGVGAPGYERYEDCPAGAIIGYSFDNDNRPGEPDQCLKTVNVCASGSRLWRYHDDGGGSCIQTLAAPRAQRRQPYYFDIRNDATQQAERHWFELNE